MPVALITGCSSGIGRALADAFKAAGYEVWTSARKPDDVAALAAAGFTAIALDVNDSVALEQLAERINQQHGGLDVLINNAGYGAMGPLLDGGVEAMQRQFETNVFSIVGVTRAFFPLLRRSRGLVGRAAGDGRGAFTAGRAGRTAAAGRAHRGRHLHGRRLFDHALARRDSLTIAELRDEAWALDSTGSSFGEFITNLCRRSGYAPRINAHCAGFEMVAAMVASGNSISIVSGLRLVRPLPGVIAVPLLPDIQRGVFLAYRKGERDHPAVNVFLDEAVYTADRVLG